MLVVVKDKKEAVNIDNAEVLCVKSGGTEYHVDILGFDGHLKYTLGEYDTEEDAVYALNCLLTEIARGRRIHCMLDRNTAHSGFLDEEI